MKRITPQERTIIISLVVRNKQWGLECDRNATSVNLGLFTSTIRFTILFQLKRLDLIEICTVCYALQIFYLMLVVFYLLIYLIPKISSVTLLDQYIL